MLPVSQSSNRIGALYAGIIAEVGLFDRKPLVDRHLSSRRLATALAYDGLQEG